MPTVTHTRFSFVRFTDDYVLPAFGVFDVAFQFLLDGTYPGTSGLFLGICTPAGTLIANAFPAPVAAMALKEKLTLTSIYYSQNADIGLQSITVGADTRYYNELVTHAQFLKVMYDDFGYRSLSDTEFLDNGTGQPVLVTLYDSDTIYRIDLAETWGQGYVKAPGTPISLAIAPGKCFRYCILDADGNILGLTNLFKVHRTEDYTTLLTYSNDEDVYEFAYPSVPSRPNVIRLPFTLSAPSWPEDVKTSKVDGGRHYLDAAYIEEQYELNTILMPAIFHRNMKFALRHDTVLISGGTLDGPAHIIGSDSYNADWSGKRPTAPGKCNVVVANFGYTNSNFE